MATHLKTVVLRTPVNESLGPKKEAPQTRGFSCFRDTPLGKAPGVGTGDGGGVVSEVEAGCEQITPSAIRLCVGRPHGMPGCGFLIGVGDVQNGGLAPWSARNL